MKLFSTFAFGATLAFLVAGNASAQWTTQSVTLRPGWNSVFLEVHPQPAECDAIFANNPTIESVWMWNRRLQTVQFIQDPATLVPPQPDWLTWLPPSHPMASDINLFALQGGKSYLIKLADNAAPANLVFYGYPSIRKTEWLTDSLNLVGFSLDRANPPAFRTFFGPSTALSNSPIYRLLASGYWTNISNTTTSRMQSGEAFWIKCTGSSDYQGPLSLSLAQRSGLDYGRTLVEQTLTLKNVSTSNRTVVLAPLPSGAPPNNSFPANAGLVPLYYWHFDLMGSNNGWVSLSAPLTTSLAPGQEWVLRLEARRAEMAAFTPPPGGSALYQSFLEIKDAAGSSRILVPVTAQGMQAAGAGSGLAHAKDSQVSPNPRAGLWIGSVSLNQVSQPASSNPTTPTNTASEFQFRLIVHVDDAGQARLLQKVLQMWKPGTTKPDTNNPAVLVVDQPGRYVLLTDDGLIPSFSGAALRDGQPVGRRFSSVAFSFRNPTPMTSSGSFGADSSLCSCQIVLAYDDPLNPFVHRYHPDHDNLDDRFEEKLPEGKESYTVTRAIQLQFTGSDPANLTLAGWGDNQVGGIYRETMTGLHKAPIHLQGIFRLYQASRVGVLNDGL